MPTDCMIRDHKCLLIIWLQSDDKCHPKESMHVVHKTSMGLYRSMPNVLFINQPINIRSFW